MRNANIRGLRIEASIVRKRLPTDNKYDMKKLVNFF